MTNRRCPLSVAPNHRGFTLIELLVVMAIISVLLMLAAPRYLGNVEKSKEAVLKENLATTRDALEKFYSDRGRYPVALQDLVTNRYLRKVPYDPITDRSDSWTIVPPADPESGAIYDVRSGASGTARDGTRYNQW